MYWLLDRKSQLTLENKILYILYKTILKLIWTYGITVGHDCRLVEILQTYQLKVFRMITSASYYITNDTS